MESFRKPRYYLLDSIRGFSVISMVLFHTVWDLVRLFGVDWRWFDTGIATFWKCSIYVVFIVLSGFCIPLGRHRLKNALVVFSSGILVTLVSSLFVPDARIVFGVLTFLGSSMLISIPAERLLKRLNPYIGLPLFLALFAVSSRIRSGFVFFTIKLPEEFYKNKFTAYLGFPPKGFWSADYFPLFPWIFLFFSGFFLYFIFEKNKILEKLKSPRILPLEAIGRHSLLIYLLHQPLIYFVLSAIFL